MVLSAQQLRLILVHNRVFVVFHVKQCGKVGDQAVVFHVKHCKSFVKAS